MLPRHYHTRMDEEPVYAPFTARAIEIIRAIPRGRVATYGQIAAAAGSPMGARQIVRILHSLSGKENLPWHRVISSQGRIALEPGGGFELQKAILESEKVEVKSDGRIELGRYLWSPTRAREGDKHGRKNARGYKGRSSSPHRNERGSAKRKNH
jgi:methylated-DNA-protein-cysteine methyltransferase-like protein